MEVRERVRSADFLVVFDQGRSRLNPEFLSEASSVCFYRLDAQVELFGDFLVRVTLGQKCQDLGFSFAKFLRRGRRAGVVFGNGTILSQRLDFGTHVMPV